jgi:hypothetical protein
MVARAVYARQRLGFDQRKSNVPHSQNEWMPPAPRIGGPEMSQKNLTDQKAEIRQRALKPRL